MARNYTKVLVITANVGSIFEDPEHMLQLWLREFLSTVKRLDPDFLAVHCQEVGGKNYEDSMQHVSHFVKSLLASEEMQQFDKARVFLDEDFTAVDKFTALGSLYFVHQSVQSAQLWDWVECKFVPVIGREVLSGNIESVSIKEKAKFPQEFFPDCKWSRKGFLRTRWNICNSIIDLVNIHLFHDASNIVAMSKTPSVYCENRSRAMRHTLERFDNDEYDKFPYLIFGDFNFRLDTHLLIKKLTDQMDIQEIRGKKNDIAKIVYTSPASGRPVLTLEKKGFDYHDRHTDFSNNNNKWLKEYDVEPESFRDQLYEYDVTFPPSYPYSEEVEDGTSYMKTRCPSWCDRILLHHTVRDAIYQDGSSSQPEYNIIGPNICMGDHKPIYLNFKLRHGTGNLRQQEGGTVAPPVALPKNSSPKSPSQKVISINGEVVDVSDMDHINIHDFATFEQKEYMTPNFFNKIRQKHWDSSNSAGWSSDKTPLTFRQVAHEVIMKENVILAMKHYSHRSDSDSETEEEDCGPGLGSTSSVFLLASGTTGSAPAPNGRAPGHGTSQCPAPDTKYQTNSTQITNPFDFVPRTDDLNDESSAANSVMRISVYGCPEEEVLLNLRDEAAPHGTGTGRGPPPGPPLRPGRPWARLKPVQLVKGQHHHCPCPCVLQ